MCVAINGDHAIFLEICSKEGYFHLQLHSRSECLPRSIVYIVL
jgi:hypothetical protein